MEDLNNKPKKVLTPYGYSWYCTNCNELIPVWYYEKGKYAYKLLVNNKTCYFCSWTCMREFEKGNKKRKYNSLKEK